MAIQKALSKTTITNSYGIDFAGVYYKIESIELDIDKDEVIIDVRGYASQEARELQKTLETNRKKFQDLSMGGDSFNIAFKESEYKKIDNFRDYIEAEKEKAMQNIVGIFKETYNISMSDLKPSGFTRDSLIKASYIYLKTLPEYSGSKDI